MDMAKYICESLRENYPNDSFVTYPQETVSVHGNLKYICRMESTGVARLIVSKGEAVDDNTLKSLLHCTVFECRATKPNLDRAMHIYDQISNMLPGRKKSVFVGETYSDSVVTVYGSHKGTTSFKDSEFGSQVTIILH